MNNEVMEIKINEHTEELKEHDRRLDKIEQDSRELIEQIDVKSNGKQLKKINNLNGALEERNIDYRIVEFSTSKMIDGKQKRYPNAWKVAKLVH